MKIFFIISNIYILNNFLSYGISYLMKKIKVEQMKDKNIYQIQKKIKQLIQVLN